MSMRLVIRKAFSVASKNKFSPFKDIVYEGNYHFMVKNFSNMTEPDKKELLKKRLTPLQYQVTQEKGTERPYTGKWLNTTDRGVYSCVCCNMPLFSSETKFDSGCGWPAFNEVLEQGKIKLTKDTSHGMIRTEVTCSNCDAHLGHVFNDGPPPKRKRFCINSASLEFYPVQDPVSDASNNTDSNSNSNSASS